MKTLRTRETETDFRNTWVIIKGQYNNRLGVDSYNPEDPNTREWYQAMDRHTYNTVACGTDFNRVLKGLIKNVKGFKTQEAYYRFLGETTTEDYYRVHFLNLPPYQQREKDQMYKEGMTCAVSIPMKELYKQVVDAYGDYYEEDVEEAVERAYRELYADSRKTSRGSVKPKKLVAKNTVNTKNTTPAPVKGGAGNKTILVPKPKKEKELLIIEDEPAPKTLRKSKVKLSIKKRK